MLSIDATGHLRGLVFVDRNGNGLLELSDAPAVGVSIALVSPAATQRVIARATSNANGLYSFADVPVGRYGLIVESPTLGDSLQVADIDSATITVAAGDTSVAVITLGYEQLTVARLDSLPLGRRVMLRGVALNAWSTFGDSTLHVADTTGALRAIRVQPAVFAAGDTIRLVGTVLSHNSAVTIGDVTAFRIAAAPLTRVPVLLSTADAATAAGGTLRNDLVRIDSATIVSTQVLPNGEGAVNVDDGSGLLQVILDPSAGFGTQPNLVPGALLDAVGLLVRRTDGSWQLKPRNAADISASIQRVTIAQARTLTPGRLVRIEGLALNGWITFGDASVHIVDPTGSLRSTEVANSSIFAGDSISFVGRIAMRDGQTVLSSVSPTVLLPNRLLAQPTVLTTQQARTADGGGLDAALVRIVNATISDTATVIGNLIVGANDGSGRLEIMIRPALGLVHSQFVPGATISATGLLVPATGGATWQLRPRGQSDITVTPAPAHLPPALDRESSE
jgi:hypothetical protein